jgi:hypothetical protein
MKRPQPGAPSYYRLSVVHLVRTPPQPQSRANGRTAADQPTNPAKRMECVELAPALTCRWTFNIERKLLHLTESLACRGRAHGPANSSVRSDMSIVSPAPRSPKLYRSGMNGTGDIVPAGSDSCRSYEARLVVLAATPKTTGVREAFGVRGMPPLWGLDHAAKRGHTPHSKRFAQFGCGYAALRPSHLRGLLGLRSIARLRLNP